MMHTELFRKQYDFELEQRTALTSATNIPIVAITVVSSAASAALLDFQYAWSASSYAFMLFIAVALVAVCFSVYSVFRSFWNYEYQKLSSPTRLRQYFRDLLDWHVARGAGADAAFRLAKEDFQDFVDERLAEASSWNGQNNLARGNFLHRATAAVAFAVVALLPAAGLYAYVKASAVDKIHQVRVVNLSNATERIVPMSDTPSSPAARPASTSAPAPAPATSVPTIAEAKPTGPPNDMFKSNFQLDKSSSGTRKK